MTDIHQTISLGPTDGARFQRLNAVVRANSHFSIMPSPLLQMLGVDPQWTDRLREPGGGEEEYSLAEVKLRSNRAPSHFKTFPLKKIKARAT